MCIFLRKDLISCCLSTILDDDCNNLPSIMKTVVKRRIERILKKNKSRDFTTLVFFANNLS